MVERDAFLSRLLGAINPPRVSHKKQPNVAAAPRRVRRDLDLRRDAAMSDGDDATIARDYPGRGRTPMRADDLLPSRAKQ